MRRKTGVYSGIYADAFEFRVFRRAPARSRREWSHSAETIFAIFCAVTFSFARHDVFIFHPRDAHPRYFTCVYSRARLCPAFGPREEEWSRPHCDSRNIHYPQKPNAASNYYVGRGTVVVAKGVVDVEE